LTRALPAGRAKAWLLSGDLYSAEEAVSLGLAVEAVPPDQLSECARDWVRRLCTHSPLAYGRMKQLIRASYDRPLTEGLRYERDLVHEYVTSHDALEGLVAFAERRAPRFRGH
jgi:enoyl-CoA hydratase/carnithine racemase